VGVTLMGDQRTGAGIMWLLGDVVGVVAGVVVVRQWMRHEERAAHRADLRDDQRRAMAGST
jgi:cytochrome c oxidase assembly factor CtaG